MMALLLCGCQRNRQDPHDVNPPSLVSTTEREGAAAYEQDVLVQGEETVTLGDIRHYLCVRDQFGELAEADLGDDLLALREERLRGLGEEVLRSRHLLSLGERLGLLPDEESILQAGRANPEISGYLQETGPIESQILGGTCTLTGEDLHLKIRNELIAEQWMDLVLSRVAPEEVRTEYFYRNRTVTVRVVQIPNIPHPQIIDEFIASPPSLTWFDEQYNAHTGRYRQPETVDLRVVGIFFSEGASQSDRDSARARAEEKRQAVIDGTDMVLMSTAASDHWAASRGGLLTRVERRQLPQPFELQEGEVGEVEETGQGFVFYRAEARYSGFQRELDEPLRREIATTYLLRERPHPRPLAAAQVALGMLRDRPEESVPSMLQGRHAVTQDLGPMHRREDGMIPGVGISPFLQDALFSLTPEEPTANRVFLVDGSLYAVALLSRNDPTEDDYLREETAFREQYDQLIRQTAWNAYWSTVTEELPIQFVYSLE